MSSEEHTGRVAATVIPRTQKGEEYLVAWRVDHEMWEFVGGKEEYRENGAPEGLEETAEREIKEELGLDIEAEEVAGEYSWQAGGHEIVPVRATHGYQDIEEHLELREEKHGRYRYIDPENHDIDLGKERNCLEAFDLA
ncbi:MAG: NUDIX hydrolase [Candidatus Nanohaloarchaea archaeon]